MPVFVSKTRPVQYFMSEDPGADIVQSWRGPRSDSIATDRDKMATSLLGLEDGARLSPPSRDASRPTGIGPALGQASATDPDTDPLIPLLIAGGVSLGVALAAGMLTGRKTKA